MRLRRAEGVEVAGMKRPRLDPRVLPNPLIGLRSGGARDNATDFI